MSPKRASLKITSGAIGTDTILAIAPELLRVEIRDSSGQLAPGVVVKFRIALPTGETDEKLRGAYACQASQTACAFVDPLPNAVVPQVDVLTDASGIATARIQHGMRAAAGVIEVSAPSLNATTSTAYATVPGVLVGFAASVADTSVYVGSSYLLTARAVDRLGNTGTDAVMIEALTSDVATFANGQVTARAIGRGSFALRAGALVKTAFVSVPPPGRFVASVADPNPGLELVLFNSDGGTQRTFASIRSEYQSALPAWHLDGRRVSVLEASAEGRNRMIAYDTATGARTALVDTITFPETVEPSYPRSGSAMYFYGTHKDGQRGLFRANPDGSDVRLVLEGVSGVVLPDESAVIIRRSSGLVRHDLVSGEEKPYPGSNYGPFWPTAGDVVAYAVTGVGNTLDLHVMRSDGSGDRVLVTGIYYASSFSPDGAWIATTRPGTGVELVRVSDGVRLPVAGTRYFVQVAWRRE
jgi:hypothetical protein